MSDKSAKIEGMQAKSKESYKVWALSSERRKEWDTDLY